MRTRVQLAAAIVLLSAASCARQDDPLAGHRVIDLTHPFDASTIYWPTAQGFRLQDEFVGTTDGGYYYAAHGYSASEHGGTHLDAPRHFAAGAHTADEVPLSRLMGPAAVIDISRQAANDADYQLSADDIRAWERYHGRLPAGAIVLVNTGRARFWPDREKYMGTAELGPDAVPLLHFPGISLDAARFMAEHRDIAAVGLDTPSIDHGQSQDFRTHRYLYERNIPGFENVAALDRLPATGATIIALPMKIAGGSGAPLRIIALIPRD